MDPYIKFQVGVHQVCSKVHPAGGKYPKWETDSFLFLITTEELVKFEVWDFNNNQAPDVQIGEGAIAMLNIVGPAGLVKCDNYSLVKNG